MPVRLLAADPALADVGDTVRTWLLVTAHDGTAAAATVTGTVTYPDDSTDDATVDAQTSVGLYLVSYDTDSAGTHQLVVTVASTDFGDDVIAIETEVYATTGGTVPDLTAVKAYLGSTSASDATISDALAAEIAAQRSRCRIPVAYPADLAQALKRRVARNLAARAVPLAVLTGVDQGGGAVRIPALDAEVRRLEAPYRRLTVG